MIKSNRCHLTKGATIVQQIKVDEKTYVVFDVETNGLSSKTDDLLSISFYKPDDGKIYDRFLPLELSKHVVTTHYNGITDKDLSDKLSLTQEEFDQIVKEFELERRIILTYSGRDFDERFLKEYLNRKKIIGFDKLTFHNMKRQIISSKFSGGNVTKDNLCKMFKIPNVHRVHSGVNDCKLEWELFKKMDGYYYLITDGGAKDNVFRFSSDYIIPVSLFASHPGIKRVIKNIPYISCQSEVIKSFEIDSKGIHHLDTNFNGVILEHLINSMLSVKSINSREFLIENKKKLKLVGNIPSSYHSVPMTMNLDGTVTAVKPSDRVLEKKINDEISVLKERLGPLVQYIKENIFNSQIINSQELVVNHNYNVLALCDLSSENAVMEIKTNDYPAKTYKEQLYFESQGRACYHLNMCWEYKLGVITSKTITFNISRVYVEEGEAPQGGWSKERLEQNRKNKEQLLCIALSQQNIELISFVKTTEPVKLKCNVCGNVWEDKYNKILKDTQLCRSCFPKIPKESRPKKKYETPDDRRNAQMTKYSNKILEVSNGSIQVSNYIGAKNNVTAHCNVCGYEWIIRADHLVSRCYCKKCKNAGMNMSLLNETLFPYCSDNS